MNWLKRIFGFIECSNCQREFKKTKNTACGLMNGKTIYYCNDCSNKFIADVFAGKDPFAKDKQKGTDGRMNKTDTIIDKTHTIQIYSPEGKTLILDFKSEKLKLSGDLEIDDAAKIFFEELNGFFQEAIQKQVKSKLEDLK